MEMELADRVGREAAPLINGGMDLKAAIAVAYHQAARMLKNEGRPAEEVDTAVALALGRLQAPPIGQSEALQEPLLAAVEEAYFAELELAPADEAVRLDEKWVKSVSEFRMDIFHDESKHRGFPHVRVQLQDGPINISIGENPEVIAGTRGLRGETAAIAAVRKNHVALKAFWDATRPDDQKLPGN